MFTAVFKPILTLLAAAAIYVRADPNPSSPGPGDVFIQGTACTIRWEADPTGTWKNMNIDLMTGDNFNMISLSTVAANVDATDPSKNTYSYTCPQVSPHSSIYFYQFTSASSTNKAWTGRFAITDSANDIVAPSQSTQPDGEKIPWGTGALVNNGSSSAGTPATSGNLVSNSSITTSSASSTTSTLPTFSSTPVQTVNSVAAAPATSNTVSVTEANGAVRLLSGPAYSFLLQTGLVLGLAALGFAVTF